MKTGILPACDDLNSRQFHIAIKRLADSLNYGIDRSPFHGSGIEFAQSRPYVAGDPIKSIDWRVTARTRQLHVKEYEAPKRMPAYLVVDTSASMTIGSGTKTKYSVAVQMAGGLALACLERVSPVGILGGGEAALHVPPTLSRDDVLRWLHQLRHYRYDEQTHLGRRLRDLEPSLKSRILLIVLSDLHDPEAIPALKLLAQRHDCCVIQLRDPSEASLRGSGLFRAREVETGRTFVTHGRAPLLEEHRVRDPLRRAGIDHLIVNTDAPFLDQLRRLFAARGLLGRGAR